MNETGESGEGTPMVDNRAAARSAREQARKDSLYNQDPQESYDQQAQHAVRQSPIRWEPGGEPYDIPGAVSGDGYVNTKLEVLEHPDPTGLDPMAGVRGRPSGVACFNCARNDYLIVDRRDETARLTDSTPEVKWAHHEGRLTKEQEAAIEPVVMLFCPGCKNVAQMLESAMMDLRRPEGR